MTQQAGDGWALGPPVLASQASAGPDQSAAASIFLEYVGMPSLMTYSP